MFYIIYRGLATSVQPIQDGKVEVLDTTDLTVERIDFEYLKSIDGHQLKIENMSMGFIWYVKMTQLLEPVFWMDYQSIYFRQHKVLKWGIKSTERRNIGKVFVLSYGLDEVVNIITNAGFNMTDCIVSFQYAEKLGDYFRLCIRVVFAPQDIGGSPKGLINCIFNREVFLGVEKIECIGNPPIVKFGINQKYALDKPLMARLKIIG